MDLETLTAAGLYDPEMPRPDERLALIEYLEGEGCSLEEMQAANAKGRLFALAGDRRIRPLVGLVTLRQAAARLEAEPALIARAWRTLGLPDAGLDTAVLTDGDVEALGTFMDVRAFLGDETAFGIARVVGAALARITEAEGAAMRAGMQVIDVEISGDEVVTARAFGVVTQLVPRIGKLLDSLHRQHLEATRTHFEDIDRGRQDGMVAFRLGVGFADLSGFTRLSQQLTLGELSSVLTAFEEAAADVVQARNGRVVKFLGDAVMWVSADPQDLVAIARDLTNHPKAREAEIDVRAGVAYGRMLVQDGDYFGPPVNLASRLVSIAEPGQVLADADLVAALSDDWVAVPGVAQSLRGIDEPVIPYALTPA